jgi:hypothetical protein
VTDQPVRVDYAAVARHLAAAATARMEAAQLRKRALYRDVTEAPAPVVRRAPALPTAAKAREPRDDDDNLSDSGSDCSSADSAASREQMRAQLDDLKDIVRVMVRGLRACDAAQVRSCIPRLKNCSLCLTPLLILASQMALRDEMATQKAGLSKLKGLATLRADLEAQHSQLQARVASLERMLGQQPGGERDGMAAATEEAAPRKPPVPRRTLHPVQQPRVGRIRADVRVTPAPQPRRVRFAAATGNDRDADATVTSYSHHPLPPVDDADLFVGAGDVALPSYAELRAAAAHSLPAELRLAGELPSGPAPALSAAAWRFATAASAALAAPEPPRPVATAPLPSVATRARTRQAQPGLDNSFSLARHAGLA